MQGFVGLEKDFIGAAGRDWEPVKVDVGGGDVLRALGAGQNPGS